MKMTGRRPTRSDLSHGPILMRLIEKNGRSLQATPVEYEKHLHKGKGRVLEHFNLVIDANGS